MSNHLNVPIESDEVGESQPIPSGPNVNRKTLFTAQEVMEHLPTRRLVAK